MGQGETKVFLGVLVLAACFFAYALGEATGIETGLNRARNSACIGYCNDYWAGNSHHDYLTCLERCELWRCK